MAKSELTIDVNLNINDETVKRCLQILSMYMTDNPDARLIVADIYTEIGVERKVVIERDEDEQ